MHRRETNDISGQRRHHKALRTGSGRYFIGNAEQLRKRKLPARNGHTFRKDHRLREKDPGCKAWRGRHNIHLRRDREQQHRAARRCGDL